MKVTTALIFAAGYGSRMLPVTSAFQKDLLPILDRPVIDYVVADCLAAGVTNIIFTVRPGSTSVKQYYTGNPGLMSHLARFGKQKEIDKLNAIHGQATFSYVEQPEDAGYGTAVPVRVAQSQLPKDEAFIVAAGDAFLWRTDGGSDMADMVKTFNDTDADGAIMALELPDEQLHRYGVLGVKSQDGHEFLKDFDEKPKPGQAPSNLINTALYVITPKLMEYVMQVEKGTDTGEYYLTDALLSAARHDKIAVSRAQGSWQDAGNVAGWLEANLTVAKSRPELAEKFAIYS
jgi:UTP--glucose-1-phosphate uridylyltransferase